MSTLNPKLKVRQDSNTPHSSPQSRLKQRNPMEVLLGGGPGAAATFKPGKSGRGNLQHAWSSLPKLLLRNLRREGLASPTEV